MLGKTLLKMFLNFVTVIIAVVFVLAVLNWTRGTQPIAVCAPTDITERPLIYVARAINGSDIIACLYFGGDVEKTRELVD